MRAVAEAIATICVAVLFGLILLLLTPVGWLGMIAAALAWKVAHA